MSLRHRPTRDVIASSMAIVMLSLLLGMPLLDVGLGAGTVSVAEEGTPAGWLDHDHGLCMMFGAAPWSPASPTPPPPAPVVRELASTVETPALPAGDHHTLHRSRAPPVG